MSTSSKTSWINGFLVAFILFILITMGWYYVTTQSTTTTSQPSVSPTLQPETIPISKPSGENTVFFSESENRSAYLRLVSLTVQSDYRQIWIWHQCQNYTIKLEFESQSGNYSKLIGKNVTISLLLDGRQVSAHLKNVRIEMKAGDRQSYEAEVNTCKDELENVKAEKCTEFTAELKADVEIRYDSTVVFEHPGWLLKSLRTELCDPLSGLLYMTAEELCLRHGGPFCMEPPHIHLHTETRESIPENPIPEPDDPLRIPAWNPAYSSVSITLSNYGPRMVVLKGIYTISQGADGNVQALFVDRADLLTFTGSVSLTVTYSSEPAVGILIFYEYV